MELTVDEAGRIVVPESLRERLGLTPDTKLQAIEQPDGVLIRRVEPRPSMLKIDGLWVHQGTPDPDAHWDRVVEEIRDERLASILERSGA
jgi:AbrB family looped-hinge helix DNA binding protein